MNEKPIDTKPILGNTKSVTVWINDKDQVICNEHTVQSDNDLHANSRGHILANFKYLASLCADNLQGKSRREASRWLGTALLRTFVDLEVNNQGTNHLEKAEEFIREQLQQQARVIYVFSTLVFTLIYAAILLFLLQSMKFGPPKDKDASQTRAPMAIGALGGSIGSFISILQRNHVLDVNPLSSTKLIISQGTM